MDDVNVGQLKRVIQTQHGVASTYVKSVRVQRENAKRDDWDGLVHIFDLKNHPSARRESTHRASPAPRPL